MTSKLETYIQDVIVNNISSDEVLESIGKFKDDKKSQIFIINFLELCKDTNDLDCLRIVLKACYVWKDKSLSNALVVFIDNFFHLNEHEIFSIKAEIDFAITIISMLSCDSALHVLAKYACREDLENLNLSAIRAIYCLESKEAKDSLVMLSKHSDEIIAETASDLLADSSHPN